MNSSAFKDEKVIFPTLPGSHLSVECHNNLGVAKVASHLGSAQQELEVRSHA